MHSSALVRLLAASLLFNATGMAQAPAQDPEVPTARRLFDQGLEHFRAGEFEAAVKDFQAANELKPHPSVLFNLGRAYAAAGQPAESVRALERYLSEASPTISAARRRAVTDLLESQRRLLGKVVITANEPGAMIWIDGVEAGTTPLLGDISLAAGAHEIRGTHAGFASTEKLVEVRPSQTTKVELELETAPSPPEPSSSPPISRRSSVPATTARAVSAVIPRSSASRAANTHSRAAHPSKLRGRIGAVSLGVGVAASALGSYFAVRAAGKWHERNQHCTDICDDQAVAAWRDATHFAYGADAAFITALATSGVGVYLLVTQPSESPSSGSMKLGVTTSRNGYLLQLQGSL